MIQIKEERNGRYLILIMGFAGTSRYCARIDAPGLAMKIQKLKGFSMLRRGLLPAALLLTIPAFYLMLDSQAAAYRAAGQSLYGAAALLLGVHSSTRLSARTDRWLWIDKGLFAGALASIWPSLPPWSQLEWLLRLGFCAVVFVRLVSLAVRHAAPRRLLQVCALSLGMLAVAGAGFYWLEPLVHTYADGLWLAFTTGATVGYGDIVPSTPASRVLAVFIVLLGYALLSLVTGSIAALLVGEDERRMRREMHADMRLLLREIATLRVRLEKDAVPGPNKRMKEDHECT
jgi:voltage-gated potassium channel